MQVQILKSGKLWYILHRFDSGRESFCGALLRGHPIAFWRARLSPWTAGLIRSRGASVFSGCGWIVHCHILSWWDPCAGQHGYELQSCFFVALLLPPAATLEPANTDLIRLYRSTKSTRWWVLLARRCKSWQRSGSNIFGCRTSQCKRMLLK